MTWLRERRLALVRELADSVAGAQAELLASNLESFERQTMRQRQLCDGWRFLEAEPPQPQEQDSAPSDVSANSPTTRRLLPRWSTQDLELAEAQTQALQQARTYAALWRRARRTVGIFCRVLASSGVTRTRLPPLAAYLLPAIERIKLNVQSPWRFVDRNAAATSTVQDLINSMNGNATVGAKAALVAGKLEVTVPQNRGDLAVATARHGSRGGRCRRPYNFPYAQRFHWPDAGAVLLKYRLWGRERRIQLNRGADSSQAILQQLQDQRGSLSGVDLNEEASHMVQYQRAFDAAAQVVTTVNDMMYTLINMSTLRG